jgi:esterase/lipase
MQLELQNKQIHDQMMSYGSSYGEEGADQIQGAIEEINNRMHQMSSLRQELQLQKDSISHLSLDNVVVTGSLENYVELRIGENIYDKFRRAEILVRDGVIQDINV